MKCPPEVRRGLSLRAETNTLQKKNQVNNSLYLWNEYISFVEEWISLDSNSSRVKINYSTSGISSGSLDIHSKRSDHWRHYPGSDVSEKYSESIYIVPKMNLSLLDGMYLKCLWQKMLTEIESVMFADMAEVKKLLRYFETFSW